MGHAQNPPNQTRDPLTDRGWGLGVTEIVKTKMLKYIKKLRNKENIKKNGLSLIVYHV